MLQHTKSPQGLDNKNNATSRSTRVVKQDQNDPARIILIFTRTAPASTVNLRGSYTDPAGNQTTGVIQDLAGNDHVSFVNRFADTFITVQRQRLQVSIRTQP